MFVDHAGLEDCWRERQQLHLAVADVQDYDNTVRTACGGDGRLSWPGVGDHVLRAALPRAFFRSRPKLSHSNQQKQLKAEAAVNSQALVPDRTRLLEGQKFWDELGAFELARGLRVTRWQPLSSTAWPRT